MIRNDTRNAETGTTTTEVIDLDAGTAWLEVDGEIVGTRREITQAEREMWADSQPTDAERVAALEAQNATLIADLSIATTLAQVRAAATKAVESI